MITLNIDPCVKRSVFVKRDTRGGNQLSVKTTYGREERSWFEVALMWPNIERKET